VHLLVDSTLVSATFWIAAPRYGYLELFQAETPERRTASRSTGSRA
jgi:hypothetical protein